MIRLLFARTFVPVSLYSINIVSDKVLKSFGFNPLPMSGI